ncbi:hypothetical protein Curi_c14560 [Gottschalkia acidurici 9a]|uniref:Uncharacterized protein n=1 Tax=Gottschalkia acidurici (strain ATCC 7906 / DSM 604 / BCRC 14475 / CIP 104303 / KCTC 5404 / NCIMB 10678 / 9a) TaxID=1128398 RepID=K0B1D5_GOTA9|nr:hypothetical protein [Gottschalkia acidurici]AFS78466.1 hypothetical protein Curi_c14560 [Gottschalkia acidurici 9a]
MKSNIKSLLMHLAIVAITLIFLIGFVISGPKFGMYTTNMLCRFLFTILFLICYIYIGSLLSTKKDKNYDFFKGVTIGLIGIGLWTYTFIKIKYNLIQTPQELNEYWMMFNLYYAPFTMIYFFLDITVSPILLLFTNLIPSLLIGLGVKYKRLKEKKIKI